MAFALNIDPNFKRRAATLADRVAELNAASAVRVPVQLPVPADRPAPRPVFGKRVVR